jgi:DNA segregation ATPase FtsK/SpoIIIE-like protein
MIMLLNIKKLAIVITLIIVALANPKQIFAQQENVSFQVFYDALSPYGQWVDYRDYGYVWIPDVGPDFAPYSTDGYWTLTDYGWTWVSDYEWGWAPFHYGRWSYDNYYGWLWVPENEWGPSWVNWRRADGYYGWSPMEPGISIYLSFGRPYNRYNDHWMFVRDRDFERRDIHNYSVDRSEHAMIIRNSTVINTTYIDNSRHTTYVTGPAREDVQRVTGRRINPVAIQENNRPGRDQNDGQLRMYRPEIVKNVRADRNPAPRRIENLENVKRPSERNIQSQQQNNARQQNINRNQPTQQPQQTAPADIRERQQKQQQQNDTRQQNINQERQLQQQQKQQNDTRQQNINKERQQQQLQNDTRQQNINKERQQQQQQQNDMKQQNINKERQQQQQQQQNDTRQQNINRERQQQQQQQQQQQNNTRQQNINKGQPAQQPQKAVPTGNIQRKQQNTVKPQNQKPKEQPKERRSEEDKKQND